MRRALIAILLLAGVAGIVRLAPIVAGDEIALFDAPRGAWLGTMRGDARLTVVERRDGWQRVRVEGWIAGGGAATAVPPAGVTAPPPAAAGTADAEPPPRVDDPGTRVRGVLRPVDDGAGSGPGSGLVVLLVPDDAALAAERSSAEQACRAHLRDLDRRIAGLQERLRQALNSSDNFRQAATENDRVREDLAGAQRERGGQVRRCRREADAVFQRHAIKRAISDATGRFEFEAVASGRYRVVATDAAVDPPRTWVLECRVSGERDIVLDERSDRSGDDPYWGVR